MTNRTTIVILAAGLGSRYGGNKQVDGLGPNNEIIMDYSIYDAITAGFDKVVFIIKKSMYESFHKQIGERVAKKMEVAYAFQEMDSMIPEWFKVPSDRVKPFGTAHALLCAKDVVDTPFCVFNADDYYGNECFKTMHNFLTSVDNTHADIKNYSMVGFELQNTVPTNGTVTRGVCQVDENQKLVECVETYKITRFPDGTIRDINFHEDGDIIENHTPVSMNFWGLTPDFFSFLEEYFIDFLNELKPEDIKKECILPGAIDECMKQHKCCVDVLPCHSEWFGVTNKEDRPLVVSKFKELHDKGLYPNLTGDEFYK